MSNKVLTLVWDASEAESTDLLMMVALADQSNDDGECWPAVGTLARKARLKSSRGAQKVLRRLVALGELSIEERRIDGARSKSNVYLINVPLLRTRLADRVSASSPTPPPGCPPVQGVGEPQFIQVGEQAGSPEPKGMNPLFTQEHSQAEQKHEEKVRDPVKAHRQRKLIERKEKESGLASDRKRLEEMLGDAYPYARTLVNQAGYSPETLLKRLSSAPRLLTAFQALTQERFDELHLSAKSRADEHTTGWESQIGPQFLSLLQTPPSTPSSHTGQSTLVNQRTQVSGRDVEIKRLTDAIGNMRNWNAQSPNDRLTGKINGLLGELRQLDPTHPLLQEVSHDTGTASSNPSES